jgi:ABC-type multidrug transport system ATPase subunit
MMDNHPALRLFQLSPAQQAVDLAARAFPIFLPEPKFVDRAPLMNPIIPAVEPAPAEPVWPLGAVTAGLLAAAGSIMAVGKIGRPFKTAPRMPTRTNEPVTAPGSQNRESTPMITVKNLTKRFGQFTAVDNLSFEIGPGEAVALWGPNGAGKTTIIRSLLGLHRFDGELRINGFDVVKAGKQARAAVGYVPQELAFYPDLTTAETLRFFAALKQIPATRIETVLTEVGLIEQRQKAVAALSGGMKQRLALAVALLADPPLLFLDEPTSSLDTKARHDFIALLLKQKQRGKTLLFTSHRLEEVEQLATRILVLQDGRLELVCARPADLAGQLGLTVNLKLIVPEPVRASALDLLQTHGFTVTPNGVGLLMAISPTAKMAPLQTLMAGNIEVENFEIENGLERLAKNES